MKPIKVLYSTRYGGFGYSNDFTEYYFTKMKIPYTRIDKVKPYKLTTFVSPNGTPLNMPNERHNTDLIEAVEEYYALDKNPSSEYANLQITTLAPGNNRYIIKEYDGYESIMEPDDFDFITVN